MKGVRSVTVSGTALGYASSVLLTAIATAICFALYGRFELSTMVMIYLAAVAIVASLFGPKEAILASLLSVLIFNFAFVHPRWTLAVSYTQDFITLLVMTGVALLIGTLTQRVRQQTSEAAEARREADLERMRSTLLAAISHDLRTPLTSIAGAAETLKHGEGNREELVSAIYSESLRLNLQVENLLDATRLQLGGVKPKLEWQSVEELLGSALARTENLLEPRTVAVHCDDDLPLVRADAILLEHVFVNLLENAARHTPESTQLRITAQREGEEVVVDFEDNGPGIPAAKLDEVFDRFTQVGKNRGGFGLGLSICREILRLHGGSISAGNRSEGGARFEIRIPLDMQPEVPQG